MDADKFSSLFDELAEEIYKKGLENKKSEWTKHVLNKLAGYGKSLGYEVRASKIDKSKGEWLYDMAWLTRKNNHLSRVDLVLESEFEPTIGKIVEDFEKLLVARASVRMMVFTRRKTAQIEETFRELEKRATSFSQSTIGDEYLLYGLSWEDGGFHRCAIKV